MKKGWLLKKLGDVCHVYQPETISQKQMKTGNYPVYGANGQIGLHNQFNHEEPQLILGCRGSCGMVHITEPRSWINGNAMVVKPTNGVMNISFLAYALQGGINLTSAITGAAQPQITRTSLMPLVISFPESLDEQKRIVALLDEAFENISIAKANTEKNLENAKALFESHLQSVFTQHGPGWVKNKLKSVTTKIGSGATPRGGQESYMSDGISLIRSLNVHDFGFKYAKLAFLDDSQADELSNVEVQPRDVLLNITGASVARCTIVPDDVLPARVNQHVSIIRPVAEKLDADFLHYLLISKPYKDLLLKTGEEGGSTRQAITKAQIQEFAIEYPGTLNEQKSFVSKLDEMLTETQRLVDIYQRKLEALEALKKSLLYQAFTGAL